jgi:hypothetical protein
MANSLQSNYNKKLLMSFTSAFQSELTVAKSVERQVLVGDFDATTGGQVAMKRPTQYAPQRTNDGDLSAASTNPIKVGQVIGEVGQFCTVLVEATQTEKALQLNQLDELLRPAAMDMAIAVESELTARMVKAAALATGTKGTLINKWSDVAAPGALFEQAGVPAGAKYLAMNHFERVNLADKQNGLGVNPNVNDAWTSATIAERFAGFDRVFASSNLAQYTVGTVTAATLSATPASTYVAYKDSYQMTLALSGVTPATGTLKAGQQIQIAASKLVNFRNRNIVRSTAGDVPITLTILEDVTAVAGAIAAVKVSGAAIFESGVDAAFNTVTRQIQSGDALVFLGAASSTQTPALAYHKGFFGMGSVQLPKLDSLDSMVINQDGFSIRVHKFSDGKANKSFYRFDILPTFCCFNPFWAIQVSGT